MRTFLLLWLLAWLIGIGLGVSDSAHYWLAAAAIMLITVLVRLHQYMPVVVSSVCLLGLGYVWAGAAVDLVYCQASQLFVGTITSVHRLEEMRAQYVVKDQLGCTILVITNRLPEYHAGNEIKVEGEQQLVTDIPSEYAGYADYLERQGVAATVRYPAIEVMDASVSLSDLIRSKWRQRIGESLTEPEASVVTAMVLADRGSIPDQVQEQFRQTGVSHVLAISGLHISIFAGLIVSIFLFLPVSAWTRTVATLVALWLYVSLIGAPISATRAAIFWTIALVAFQLRALVSLPTVIILAATALISFNPSIIQDVGLQLSFTAVAGIGLALFLTKSLQHRDTVRPVMTLIVVSSGAALGTWPIIAYHFHSLSLIGIVANLLVVPLVPVFLSLASLTLLVAFMAPSLAVGVGLLLHIIWQWIDWVTALLASIPGANIDYVELSWWIISLYYLGLLAISVFVVHRQGRSWREIWQ